MVYNRPKKHYTLHYNNSQYNDIYQRRNLCTYTARELILLIIRKYVFTITIEILQEVN